MDGMLWHLIWINLITPNFPFIFQTRVAITTAAAGMYPWWFVLCVANFCGGLGMLPVYYLTRWARSRQQTTSIGDHRLLAWLFQHLTSSRVVMAAYHWLIPPGCPSWRVILRRNRKYRRFRYRWRPNMFTMQIAMNGVQLPDAVSGAMAGAVRYPVWKLLLSQLIGRTLHNGPLVAGGAILGHLHWFMFVYGILVHPLMIVATTLIGVLIWKYKILPTLMPQTVA